MVWDDTEEENPGEVKMTIKIEYEIMTDSQK